MTPIRCPVCKHDNYARGHGEHCPICDAQLCWDGDEVERLGDALIEAGMSRPEVKDRLFAFRYGGRPAFKLIDTFGTITGRMSFGPTTKETSIMSKQTLSITIEQVEKTRFRASVPQGAYGIFTEASDPGTAVMHLVDAYVDANPDMFVVDGPPQSITVNNVFAPAPRPRQFGRAGIDGLMRDLVISGGAVRIEYEDSEGHVTERVIEPKEVVANGDVLAWDRLRLAIRRFKPRGIKWAEEV